MNRTPWIAMIVVVVAASVGGLWWACGTETHRVAPAVADSAKSAGPGDTAAATERLKTITFDDLKFDLPTKETPFERSMLGPKIEDLVGKRVKVRGYMLPSFKQTLTQLVLMRDNQECCFGPGAWIYDCVVVDMVPGKTAEYSLRPVDVEGVFSIQPLIGFDGETTAIYHIDGERVQ